MKYRNYFTSFSPIKACQSLRELNKDKKREKKREAAQKHPRSWLGTDAPPPAAGMVHPKRGAGPVASQLKPLPAPPPPPSRGGRCRRRRARGAIIYFSARRSPLPPGLRGGCGAPPLASPASPLPPQLQEEVGGRCGRHHLLHPLPPLAPPAAATVPGEGGWSPGRLLGLPRVAP